MTILEKNLERIVAKGGFKSKADAMRKANYSSKTARTPKKSKIWPKLLEKYLPDDGLLIATEEALKADKWNDFTGERESDHTVRLKAADQGYKLKGRYPKEGGVNINEAKILVLPSVLIKKYGISSDTRNSSE